MNETILPPNYLTGDLDSCWPSSKQKLIDMGTKVIPTIDQNHTDFTKSLLIIQPDLVSKDVGKLNDIIVGTLITNFRIFILRYR